MVVLFPGKCGASEGYWSLTQEFLLLALSAEAIATWEEGVGVGLDVPRQTPHVQTQSNLQREQSIGHLSEQPHWGPMFEKETVGGWGERVGGRWACMWDRKWWVSWGGASLWLSQL